MIDYQEVKEATVYPSFILCGPSTPGGCVASMLAPCYAVTLPDTYSTGQYVTRGHIKKKRNHSFPFSSAPNWHKLDPDR